MPLKACIFNDDGTITCGESGEHCHAQSAEMAIAGEEFNHFIHTSMTPEERKNLHDDTLAKLTDDVNNLIREAEKKRPDQRIGILVTPYGFFFRYNSTTPHTQEQWEKGTKVTNENVDKLLKLDTSNKY
jgi:hypothetical protein